MNTFPSARCLLIILCSILYYNDGKESLVPNMDFGNLNEKATNLVGGDMVPPKGKNVLLSAVKWPNAQIPYVISAGYSKPTPGLHFLMLTIHNLSFISTYDFVDNLNCLKYSVNSHWTTTNHRDGYERFPQCNLHSLPSTEVDPSWLHHDHQDRHRV